MNKLQILALAKQHGYILIYPQFSRKAKGTVWVAKVPTTIIKQSPGFVRTRKILEDADLEQLKIKIEKYLGEDKERVKIVVREHRYANEMTM